MWYGPSLNCGLLHPLLPLVEDKDVSQWTPKAASSPAPGSLVSRGPGYKIDSFEIIVVGHSSS